MKQIAIVIISIISVVNLFGITPGVDAADGEIIKIVDVKPTILFKNDKKGLFQGVDITIENKDNPTTVELIIRSKINKEISVELGPIVTGKDNYRIYIPEISDSIRVEFRLEKNNKLHDNFILDWSPRKHWEVCLVPMAHHDLGYTAPIETVLGQYDGSYKNILRFCEITDDYPEEAKYRYSIEGTWSIQHFIENADYETLEKFADYVQEGRIDIHAFYGNSITNMNGHEELIRSMYPSFRLSKRFGGKISVGNVTDIPGLAWALPTVLTGAGIRYFFAGLPKYFEWGRDFFAPRPDFGAGIGKDYDELVKHTFWDSESIIQPYGRPDAFYWEGPDKSKVLLYYAGGYGSWAPAPRSYEQALNELPDKLNEMDDKGSPFSVVRYGFACGDNSPADMIVSEVVKEWNEKWAYPKLIVATSTMFFEKLDKECKNNKNIRTFRGDLPETDYLVGALSSAKETSLNRRTHEKLSSAEKLATMSHLLCNSSYPSKEITNAYDNMILFDEHTWGRGPIYGELRDWAWNEKSHFAYKAAGLAEALLSGDGGRKGLPDAIASSIEFKEKGQHIVVFNSLSFTRNDLVTVHDFSYKGLFYLMDTETGQTVPYQVVELNDQHYAEPYDAARFAKGQSNQINNFNLVFEAKNVPAMGYKSFRLIPKGNGTVTETSLVVNNESIENQFYRLMLNPHTGTVISIYDKENKLELIDKDAPHELNQLITRWVITGKEESPENASIRIGQTGPVYASLIVSTSVAGCPKLTQEIRLYDKIKRIDISNRVLKDETPLQELFFAFPFEMKKPDFHFEAPLSVIKPIKDQFPGSNTNYYAVQHWANVFDGDIGITFTPVDAHIVELGGLNPTVVSQAHHTATPSDFLPGFVSEFTKGYMYSFLTTNNFRTNFRQIQSGDLLFRYSIVSHRKDWTNGRSSEFGWAASNPLIPVQKGQGNGKGNLPEALSVCQVDKSNIMILALKMAEDGNGIILRLNEMEGRETETSITFPYTGIEKAYETDIVEENKNVLDIVKGERIKVKVPAFGIKTIRVFTGS